MLRLLAALEDPSHSSRVPLMDRAARRCALVPSRGTLTCLPARVRSLFQPAPQFATVIELVRPDQCFICHFSRIDFLPEFSRRSIVGSAAPVSVDPVTEAIVMKPPLFPNQPAFVGIAEAGVVPGSDGYGTALITR